MFGEVKAIKPTREPIVNSAESLTGEDTDTSINQTRS